MKYHWHSPRQLVPHWQAYTEATLRPDVERDHGSPLLQRQILNTLFERSMPHMRATFGPQPGDRSMHSLHLERGAVQRYQGCRCFQIQHRVAPDEGFAEYKVFMLETSPNRSWYRTSAQERSRAQ